MKLINFLCRPFIWMPKKVLGGYHRLNRKLVLICRQFWKRKSNFSKIAITFHIFKNNIFLLLPVQKSMVKLASKCNRQWVCGICRIKCSDAVILSLPKRLKFRIWWVILSRFWHRSPWYPRHKSSFITSKAMKLYQIAFKSISTMTCKITYVFICQTNCWFCFNCNVESKP